MGTTARGTRSLGTKRLAGLFVIALITSLLPGFFSPANAAITTWVVDGNAIGTPSDCTGTPTVTHNSVAVAVNAASAEDTVLVCPGTYVEPQIRVVVDDLTIQGEGAGVSIIQRPGATSYGIHAVGDSVAFSPVYTDSGAPGGADGLVLRDFTMDGQRTSNVGPRVRHQG